LLEVIIAAVVVFGLAFLSMSLGMLRGRECLNCSCKAAKRIMDDKGATHCVDMIDGECSPRHRPELVQLNDPEQ